MIFSAKTVEPVLRDIRSLGVSRSLRARLSNPLVVAAAMVQMAVEDRKLRPVTPLEMEAIVRLCGDRDTEPFAALEDNDKDKPHKRKKSAWKRLLWKAHQLIPSLRKVAKTRDHSSGEVKVVSPTPVVKRIPEALSRQTSK